MPWCSAEGTAGSRTARGVEGLRGNNPTPPSPAPSPHAGTDYAVLQHPERRRPQRSLPTHAGAEIPAAHPGRDSVPAGTEHRLHPGFTEPSHLPLTAAVRNCPVVFRHGDETTKIEEGGQNQKTPQTPTCPRSSSALSRFCPSRAAKVTPGLSDRRDTGGLVPAGRFVPRSRPHRRRRICALAATRFPPGVPRVLRTPQVTKPRCAGRDSSPAACETPAGRKAYVVPLRHQRLPRQAGTNPPQPGGSGSGRTHRPWEGWRQTTACAVDGEPQPWRRA